MQGVAKAYGRRHVLAEVDLEVSSGELAGIVGENGSGKSTLLQIVVGRLRADSGRVWQRGRLGYCPQEHMLFEALTVKEHVAYFARAYGLDAQAPAQLAWHRELIERLAFEQHLHDRVAHLSGGTRQKLNLMLALLHRPNLLVLDEPYAGFDWDTYLRFWDLADELRRAGHALLVVSHLVYDHSRFDQLHQLRDGRLHSS